MAIGAAALVVGSGGAGAREGAGERSGVDAGVIEGAGVGVGLDLGTEVKVVEVLKFEGVGAGRPAPGLPTGVTDAKIKV